MMIIYQAKILKKTNLDYAVAEEFFGWRWLTFFGRPERGTPGYPAECQVRRFFPPEKELHKSWLNWFKENPTAPATGDEPLDYSYCSSNGPHPVPFVTGDFNAVHEMEKEIDRRKRWKRYQEILAGQCRKPHLAKPEDRCIAALAAVGSKYVTQETPAADCPVHAGGVGDRGEGKR